MNWSVEETIKAMKRRGALTLNSRACCQSFPSQLEVANAHVANAHVAISRTLRERTLGSGRLWGGSGEIKARTLPARHLRSEKESVLCVDWTPGGLAELEIVSLISA